MSTRISWVGGGVQPVDEFVVLLFEPWDSTEFLPYGEKGRVDELIGKLVSKILGF